MSEPCIGCGKWNRTMRHHFGDKRLNAFCLSCRRALNMTLTRTGMLPPWIDIPLINMNHQDREDFMKEYRVWRKRG